MLRQAIRVLLVNILCLTSVWAQPNCLAQARGPYEKLYCEVKAQGGGAGLPSLADFRRNPPETQALLLRRPARRLGLTVPEPATERGPAQPQSKRPLAKPQSPETKTERPVPEAYRLQHCALRDRFITCADGIFRLADNRPNSQLAPGVLQGVNRLELDGYAGAPGDDAALRRYLLDAYQQYLEKMLDIGLGGATLTFSKFYYSYQELGAEQRQFPERMATMYRFLQKDKAAMTVQPRHTSALPQRLEQCGKLSEALIVCDEDGVNWVYVRDGAE